MKMNRSHELRFLRYQIVSQATWQTSSSKFNITSFNVPFNTTFFGNVRECKSKVMEYLYSAIKESFNRIYIDVNASGYPLQTDYLTMLMFDIMIDEQFYCFKVRLLNNNGVPDWEITEVDPDTPIVFTNI